MGTPQNSKNKVVKYKFILRKPKQTIIDLNNIAMRGGLP